ncbi:phosphoesterase [Lactococcus hodotermopsidis]|uniref:Phosphoesterase n=1 Tax=Pseudolactococcus hodotermopsidis TaxID=2709157 RepID=A0A6A0B905_9LACT|nr:metallophosphoesterase [Lactococcus hodotermopsidis]GFH41910.1 phosphoesterase [Lactococcus hodotermopsidis]
MIIVMSDSHGNRKVVEDIKEKYLGKVDGIFHCGDSEQQLMDETWDRMSMVVKGNCDYDSFPTISEMLIGNDHVFTTHGHLHGVAWGLERLVADAKKYDCNIALFGHLHRPIATVEDGVLCLNPGSVSQPRGKHNIKMYAKIEPTTDSYKISYMDLNHQEIPELQFNLPRK